MVHTYIMVDDETLIRKGTIKKIGGLDGRAKCLGEAENGMDALELLERVDPEIVITDMHMPVMDGVDFLKTLRERYPQKQIIVISGYKEFEYARQAVTSRAVSYVLKPFGSESIRRSILDAIQNIENDSLVQSRLSSIDTIERENESAKLALDLQTLHNLILGYRGDETPALLSQKLATISQSHQCCLLLLYARAGVDSKTVADFVQTGGYGGLVLSVPQTGSDNIGSLIVFLPEEATAQQSRKTCGQIAESLVNDYRELGKDLLVGIGGPVSSPEGLAGARKDAVGALNLIQTSEKRGCFFSGSDIAPSPLVWEKLDELLFRMEAGETEAVRKLTGELFGDFASRQSVNLLSIKFYCIELTQKTKMVLANYIGGMEMDGGVSQSVQNIVDSMFDIQELEEYVCRFLCNISETIKPKSIYAGNGLAENIQQYLQKNYRNDVTLDFVASLFYVSRSYCSHLFKEKTGENFVDYLNRLRIEQAKLLLKNSNKRIYQISKAVGYDNVKYFYRVFKKFANSTPEKCRKASHPD